MKRGLGMTYSEMGDEFAKWNTGVLDSFLIEITRDVLKFTDDDGKSLVEKILDSAGQKGTGKWTAINALDLGMPVTLIGEAVFARCLSSIKDERTRAAKVLSGPKPSFTGDRAAFLKNLEQGLYASKIISYAQGFMLMQTVSFPVQIMRPKSLTPLTGCQAIRLETQQAIDCADVAWWMYYPIGVPEGHHGCLPYRARSRKPAFQRFLQQGYSQRSRWLERCHLVRSQEWNSHACFQHCTGLLRWIPHQGSACQPAPGPA